MKSITIYGYGYRDEEDDWKALGELVHEIDESQSYEQDASLLFKNGKKYTLLDSNGCSCWDGDWEGWTDLTKVELKKLGVSWSNDQFGSSASIGKWITENIK